LQIWQDLALLVHPSIGWDYSGEEMKKKKNNK